jgi:hypothetical protein
MPTRWLVASATLAITAFLLACGGDTAEKPQMGLQDGVPSPEGEAASDDLRHEIATTLEGFFEAFMNGEVGRLATYWSETCSADDVDQANDASVLAKGFIGGKYDATVDSEALLIEVTDSNHVTVPAVQPEGVFTATIDGRPLPPEESEAADEPLELVREDGVWRVADCAAFAASFEGDEATPEPSELQDYPLREPITVHAADLPTLLGQDGLEGEVTITFLEVEYTNGIEDQFTGQGTIEPRGRFVVVYYSVRNDLNVKMQPSTQISDEIIVTDDRGRQWEAVDYTGDYGGVSGSAAVGRGYEQPEEIVPPGFENTTAVVYDVPLDATGLALVWPGAGIRVTLPTP